MKTAFLIVCLTAAFFGTGESLICYQCHEGQHNEKDCSDLKNNDQCTNAVYCVKDILYRSERTGSRNIMNRNCLFYYEMVQNGWTEERIEANNPLTLQVVGGKLELHLCKTDYCNSASIIKSTFTILTFALILLQYYF